MGAELSSFLDAWELFRDPLLAGAIAGGLLGALGVWVVLRRMVFLSAALSQSAGLGVSLEFYAQLHWGASGLLASPLVGATAATLLATALLSGGRTSSRRDATLGWAYLAGAAGTVALGTRIVQEVQDIHSILFGSAVVVTSDDLQLLALVAGAIVLLHVVGLRGFVQASFDPEGARVRGLPVRALEAVLLACLAIAVSVTTRVLGALPVFAFSVLPALVAVRLAVNVPRALAVAALLGAACGAGGYVVAFVWALPVGAAQALIGVAAVAAVELVGAATARLVRLRATT